jgi:hypothetical protein
MVNDGDAAEVRAGALCGRPNLLLAAEQRDARNFLLRAEACRDDRARVFAFGQDYVLQVGRGALAKAFEYAQKAVVGGRWSVVSSNDERGTMNDE